MLILLFPVLWQAPRFSRELLFAKILWISLIGAASFRVFVTGLVSRSRSLFFIIFAWAFIVEFKSQLLSVAGSFWKSPLIQEVPYCHIAIASTLLNHLYSAYLAFTTPNPLQWMPLAAGVFFWLLGSLTIGQGWCSWACFYGGLDTTFSKLIKKPVLKWAHLPRGVRDFSLALFVTMILLSFAESKPFYCVWICPLKLSTGFLDPENAIRRLQLFIFASLGILFIVFIPLFVKKRTFCTFLCPFGAWQALVGNLNPFRVKIDPALCTHCKKCVIVCPVFAIDPYGTGDQTVSSYCNRCGECSDVCPSGAIDYTLAWAQNKPAYARPFFLVSAWIVGGAVSLLFVPSAMLKIAHWFFGFFGR